ncbi:serine/threonine-protein kinase [Nocardia sp. KC 131]|uniref:serine/threonine-protein kinase n=1 Tax=Nocardia arseniciresistens TaxID=3392119 RepID=UPI00398F14F1
MLQKGELFAGYAIQRVLGQGGMGTVYLAKHPRLPRLTALKLLKRELYSDIEIRGRFEREADLVAQLDHPNIVTVYDRGAEDEQLWISMQFVPGADASCADVNVLAPGRAVQIVGDTAKALDFAHANGVLHRDVKPANILLAKAPIGQPERVLLTDFGIAGMRDGDTTLSSAGSITATLAYAAPEQLLGLPLDDRADQYALACTLFWMLTGLGPYPGTGPAAVINGHLYGQVPSVCRTRPGIPPALDGVLARAMSKRPTDRFASCSEFAAAARWALSSGGRGYSPSPGQSGQHGHSAPRGNWTPTIAAPPTSATPPTPPASQPTEIPHGRPERAGAGVSRASAEPVVPRMPLPPRRTPRPGTIALPDIRVRPIRSAPPRADRQGGQQPPEPRPPP